MIIADTSGLLAFFNTQEPTHARARRALEASNEPVIVSPFVLAELDYLTATRMGASAELTVLRELASGAYVIPPFGESDLGQAADIIERYRDLDIGLADASIVVLAARFRTRELLTLDRRHFEAVRPIGGGRFKLLP